MKRGKIKVVIIYLLVLVLICLVSYLIYFINNTKQEPTQKPQEESQTIIEEVDEVPDKCIFDVTLEQFNTLSSNPSSIALCEGKNKINISDVTLNNETADIYSYYYNGETTEIDNTIGIYLNDLKIVSGNKNTIGVFNNLVFIKNTTKYTNVLVFDNNAQNIYNLENVLTQTPIEDPVFTEMNKTNQNINTKVSLENIDSNSFNFQQTEFTFNTTLGTCVEGQMFKGSTYKVTFNEGTFTNPTFVQNVNC